MANRRFIDFPIASSVGENDIILIWQSGANKQTTKGTLLSGIATELENLTDVQITSLANGQILEYDSVIGKWKNVAKSDTDLSDLGDVSIVSPVTGQVLVYNATTGNWENSSAGLVPYVGAVSTVNLGNQQLIAGKTTITSNGGNDTLIVNHTSGSGIALDIAKKGSGEGLRVVKISGSGNAVTITGGNLEAPTIVKTGGTSSEFLKADGSVDSNAYALNSALSSYQLLADKGQPNGYASLDANSKVPLVQINDALIGNVNFQGLWNASTNTPTLVNPPTSDTKGYYYIVDTGGTFASITFEVGDWIISNGTAWGKVDNTDAVSSVFGRTGNVVASNGDYNTSQVTENTNLYYTDLRARGSLSFVAGSGAYNSSTGVITIPTNNNQITNGAGYITGNQTITLSGVVTGSGTTAITTAIANGTITNAMLANSSFFIGTTSIALGRASAAQTLTGVSIDGNAGTVTNGVYTTGNQTINGIKTFSQTIVLSNPDLINALDLSNNNIVGVNNIIINDPGPNEGIEWAGGNLWKIYESPNDLTTNTGGNLQIVENLTRRATFNTSGQLELPIATGTAPFVIASTTRVLNLNVATSGTADTWTTARTITIGNTGKSVNGSANVAWSLAEIGAYAATNPSAFIALTALSGVAPIEYNNTTGAISITQASGSTNGFLSSTDWNTFNNKTSNVGTVTSVAALTIGTTGTNITSTVANGTTTPVITLNVPTASAANRGALSAADWTTFNNKQNALTNPVTGTGAAGQVSFWNGTTTQTGDNGLFWNNTNKRLGVGTDAPAAKLHVVDGILISDLITTQPKISFTENLSQNQFVLEYDGTGSGAGNYVAFYSENTGWAAKGQGFNYIPLNGFVGIGTNSPNMRLHVSDTINGEAGLRIRNISSEVNATAMFRMNNDNGTDSASQVLMFLNSSTRTADGGVNTFSIRNNIGALRLMSTSGADVSLWTSTTDQRMTITSGGNVLIGTTTPNGNTLRVNGTGWFDSSVTANGNIISSNTSGSAGLIGISGSQAGAKNYIITNVIPGITNVGLAIRNTTDARSELTFSGTGAATFSSSVNTGGNVNVGSQLTFSPADARLISGSTTFAINNNANTANQLLIQNSDGAATFRSGIATSGYTASSSYAAIFNGAVGIGTNVPSTANNLTLSSSGAFNLQLTNPGTGGATWQIGATNNDYSSGGDRLVFTYGNASANSLLTLVQSTGNVGIGETNPAGRLEVKSANFDTAYLTRTIVGAASLIMRDSNNSGGVIQNIAGGGIRFLNRSAGVNSSSIIDITSAGNVLIGKTTDNGARLQVNGNLSVQNSLLAQSVRTANRGEFFLNGVGTNDVSDLFFGFGNGYNEANIRWGISDRGTTDGNLTFFAGPANGGFSSVLSLNKTGLVTINNNLAVGNTSIDTKTTTGVGSTGVGIANLSGSQGSTYFVTGTDGTNYFRSTIEQVQTTLNLISTVQSGTFTTRSFAIVSGVLNLSITPGTWTIKVTQIRHI